MAVFLATDDYDHESGVISATGLLKPTRQLVLNKRINPAEVVIDISGLVSSRMGSAIHAGIEKAWLNPKKALIALGYPKAVWENVMINPTPEQLKQNTKALPVYMEQRAYKEINGFTVSGKYDFVAEGKVQDFKSTSVYTYLNQTNIKKYILQGSIYRWLNPTIITRDEMTIHYIFTDWSKASALTNPKYPQSRVFSQTLKLLSLAETEAFVNNVLTKITMYKDSPEKDLPECTDEDLWRKESVWKYYPDPLKTTGKSSKNFDDPADAHKYLAEKGKGVIIEVRGKINACKYCSASALCTQKDRYIATGELVLDD